MEIIWQSCWQENEAQEHKKKQSQTNRCGLVGDGSNTKVLDKLSIRGEGQEKSKHMEMKGSDLDLAMLVYEVLAA